MASRFSGALQITNLDDFITPSQECIKPIEIQALKSKTGAKIKIKEDETPIALNETGQFKKLEKVEITLADCLACSGCITSAESILVTQQSQEELMRVFREKTSQYQNRDGISSTFIVVSLSVQAVLSIAEHYNLNSEQALNKLAGYFYQLGTDIVLDMTVADDFALLESAKEFIQRYRANKDGAKNQLPMLSSSCPGWVCYAEKTHGNFILPYISVTKSPQQIMGSLVKYHLAEIMDLSPEQIYHITVMPCYDKKLEASREDFYNHEIKSRDVDCVITPIEIEQMFNEYNVILNEIKIEKKIQRIFESKMKYLKNDLYGHSGSGSGGYAEFILRYAAKYLFNETDIIIEFKSLRNPDFQEAVFQKDGQTLLTFAIVNGFRNIQNLVQKLKREKCIYDYVEVMACPCGCLNGGAQIRPLNNVQSRELALKLESMYRELPQSNPEQNLIVKNLYKNWLGGECTAKALAYFHTQYHEIKKIDTALAIKW
ncbi:probable cytosolic Fe-S cluster assembly factor AGAP009023 [Apis laboriosa]|uniref:probable cytosolic Fe-S cluster assembly factor AGAP009023 n=1 Tax=Apis laboriosa TaxID=183418 RepID=UPI001CC7F891|nr:probable cytosolic Fe-S cluster assembly factor AGAP009023 [Apis laboriosa]XP_043802743.1 probable cytosolic Fe-S cluster assembly factor AGAP009023 [Apis laboriosa]XP_043802744.1 probable cytosolic Fe-S cluster assembly factor AGAP009023 [Apis laboriosa]XP_043802745.1 probable cytosolic Fe-S cluster assembly factor AGAP009023 [Apis laboriosa]